MVCVTDMDNCSHRLTQTKSIKLRIQESGVRIK
jgi:hypothetical protein